MKNLILTFFLILGPGFTGLTQSFQLTEDSGPLANGSVVFQSGPSDTLQLITWLHITNQSGNNLRVMMKKQEISLLPGTNSSICWAGYCYGPEMLLSTFPLEMQPGETVSGCFGHYGPNGCRGVSIIRWTFFSESDPADSLSVTVHYSTFPAATHEIPAPQYSIFAAGAIPADKHIAIRHSLPSGKQGWIELRNLNGKLIEQTTMVVLSGTVIFHTAHLASGVYFATLVVEGKPVVTKKTPVRH